MSVGVAAARKGGGAARPGAVRSTAWLAASGMATIAVCYGLARFAYGLFVPAFSSEFGLDAATAGAIASGSYAAYCVAIVVATVATDRWGPRVVATAAGLAAAVGTGLVAIAPDVVVLTAGVLIGGSSTGLASPPLAAAVSRCVPADRADRVQTVVNAGTGVGVMVSGPVALLVASDWRWAWAAFGVLALLVTAWSAAAVPGRQRQPVIARDHRPPASATGQPSHRWLRTGTARLLLAATTTGVGSAAVWVFGRDVVVATGTVSPLASTMMWIVLGAAGTVAVFTGDVVGRIGLGRAWVAGTVLLAAATTTIGLVPGSLPAIFSASAVFGGVYIALTGVLLVWGTRLYPDRPAVGVGAPFLLLALGQAVAAPVIGLLSDVTTPAVAFCAAASVAAMGAFCAPRVAPSPRPRAHRRRAPQ